MNPLAFMILALLTPFGFCITLFVPLYLGIFAAAYIIYYFGPKPHSLADRATDVFYIADVYLGAFNLWLSNTTAVDFFTYTLPLIALPAIGLFISLWMTRKYMRMMGEVFHLSAGGQH